MISRAETAAIAKKIAVITGMTPAAGQAAILMGSAVSEGFVGMSVGSSPVITPAARRHLDELLPFRAPLLASERFAAMTRVLGAR
ncbi:hypothetical protein GCM10009850_076460 [Nonomuraea monospora]|uniref:Uncharacterized protein n=1 Tax=Nonomuraea monospora TaxID=568818 RepID=A0ABN3CSH5_9ACTN